MEIGQSKENFTITNNFFGLLPSSWGPAVRWSANQTLCYFDNNIPGGSGERALGNNTFSDHYGYHYGLRFYASENVDVLHNTLIGTLLIWNSADINVFNNLFVHRTGQYALKLDGATNCTVDYNQYDMQFNLNGITPFTNCTSGCQTAQKIC